MIVENFENISLNVNRLSNNIKYNLWNRDLNSDTNILEEWKILFIFPNDKMKE